MRYGGDAGDFHLFQFYRDGSTHTVLGDVRMDDAVNFSGRCLCGAGKETEMIITMRLQSENDAETDMLSMLKNACPVMDIHDIELHARFLKSICDLRKQLHKAARRPK
jgi:hypothetical protein